MATLRNKRKLAAVTRETQEENPRNGQSRNTSVPRINEEYITQVSEQIEGRVTKKLSQEFSRTESRILGALSKLDEFLLNQQIRRHSETVPGTFRNTKVESQGTNEDDSQSDPHPEVGPSVCQSRHSIDSDTGETHDTMTGAIEQTTKGPHNAPTTFLNKKVFCRPSLYHPRKLFRTLRTASFVSNFKIGGCFVFSNLHKLRRSPNSKTTAFCFFFSCRKIHVF